MKDFDWASAQIVEDNNQGTNARQPIGIQPRVLQPKQTQQHDDFDWASAQIVEPPVKPKGVGGFVKDTALHVGSGLAKLPGTVLAGADALATGGKISKAIDDNGLNFGDQLSQKLQSGLSEQYKQQQRGYQEAGEENDSSLGRFVDKTAYALKNPALITGTIAESLPDMVAGGLLGRKASKATKGKISSEVGAALGEGYMMAGHQAEDIRQQTEDGLLTPEQRGYVAATGVAGALFGLAGNKIAQQLGIADIDTLIAKGISPSEIAVSVASMPAKSIPKAIIQGAITEGVFEELPQEISETILQNLALGKPWSEGIDEAAPLALLAGAAMGGTVSGASAYKSNQARRREDQDHGTNIDPELPPDAPISPVAPQFTPPPQVQDEFRKESFGFQKPSERMGLNPNDGSLSAAAALAVDSGVTAEFIPREETGLGQGGIAAQNQYTVDEWGNILDVNGKPVQQEANRFAQLEQKPKDEPPKPSMFEVDSSGNTRQTINESEYQRQQKERNGKERIDLSSLNRKSNNQGEELPPITSKKEDTASIWNGLNTYERNKYASEILGERGVLAKKAAASAWDKLNDKQKSKLEADLSKAIGTRWNDPNKSIADDDKPVLQNRDRSNPIMVEQMMNIRNNPDYSQVSYSRDFGNGAPVVEQGAKLTEEQLGRQEEVTTAKGRKIPVQYAVVEAEQLQSSNRIDGTPFAEYANAIDGKSRAIAGNGRITGLQAAWESGKAEQYKEAMIADDLHGIAPEVIDRMNKPILVRIMPNDMITNDIGDESNQQRGSEKTVIETAVDDSKRLDLSMLKFNEDGEVDSNTILSFVNELPLNERNSLVSEGMPSHIGKSRFMNALFQQTYESEELTQIQTAVDNESAKNILNGMATAAPSMVQLRGAGEYDIRPAIAEAASHIINMQKRGFKIADAPKQVDAGFSDDGYEILKYLSNTKSSKQIGETLKRIADESLRIAETSGTDMFGEIVKPAPSQIIDTVLRGNSLTYDGENWGEVPYGADGAVQIQPIQGRNETDKQQAAKAGEAPSKKAEIESAANEVETNPSEAQKDAGNYKKGHVSIQGLDIAIENPKGSERSGIDENGNRWSVTMVNHYGYIKRTEGADGDHVDVFIGEKPESDKVFIVDQINQENGSFDEHKVMLGFTNQIQALNAYRSNYSKGWKAGKVRQLTMDEFKQWLEHGDTTKPVQDFNLQQETEQQIKDREQAQQEAKSAAEKTQTKQAQKEKADEEVKRFSLTGSDMPADVAASQGQTDIFADNKPQTNPNDFVTAPNGSIDFGEITPEIAKAIGRQAGKIRLTNGIQNSDGTGYGLAHIEANHGEQIRSLGYETVENFVQEIASKFSEVWRAKAGQLLVTIKDGRKDVMFIQLSPSEKGDYYRVNSAFPVRQKDYEDRKGMKLLWDGSEPTSIATGQQSAFAAGKPIETSSKASPNARNQSIGNSVAQKPTNEQETALPEILAQTQNAYMRNEVNALKKRFKSTDSVAYKMAYKKLADKYESDYENALAHTSFEQYSAINSDTPESINRAAWEALREDYNLPIEEAKQKDNEQLPSNKPDKQFLNGDEATSRNITSSTYERAQQRTKNEVDAMFSGRSGGADLKITRNYAEQPFAAHEGMRSKIKTGELSKQDAENVLNELEGNKEAVLENLRAHSKAQLSLNYGKQFDEKLSKSEIADTIYSEMTNEIKSFIGGESTKAETQNTTLLDSAQESAKPTEAQATTFIDNKERPIYERIDAVHKHLNNGKALTVNDLKTLFEDLVSNQIAAKNALSKLTKNQLAQYVNGYVSSDTKKDELVRRAFNGLVNNFRFIGNDKGVISTAHGQDIVELSRNHINSLTDEHLENYAKQRKALIEERIGEIRAEKERLDNPQTLEDYQKTIRARGMGALNDEQKATYDRLVAERSIQKEEKPAVIEGLKTDEALAVGEVTEGKNTKTGETIYNVKVIDRLGKDKFKEALGFSRKLKGGYWKGEFYFPNTESAEQFRTWLSGSTVDLSEQQAQQAQAKQEKAVDKLKAMAERIEAQANAVINADRKTNTNRRADMAANIIGRAEKEAAHAQILSKIADGEAPLLVRLTDKTQVQLMDNLVSGLRYSADKSLINTDANSNYSFKPEVTPEQMVRNATYPLNPINIHMAENLAKDMGEVSGYKLAAAYLNKNVSLAKRGNQNGFTISPKYLEKIYEYVAKHGKSHLTYTSAVQNRKRLERMGIDSLPALRAALVEFITLKQAASKPQAITKLQTMEQELERKVRNNRNAFNDFFPTPDTVANEVVDLADIQSGMRVLEPSAGNGQIADAIRATGATLEVAELSYELSNILREKGHKVIASDFMEDSIEGDYDRIVMNPPFSKDQDIDHVMRAYELLKPNGRLVAIVSSMAGDRANNKNKAFRQFLDEVGAEEQGLPEGAFKSSMNPTGVNTKVIIIDKPEQDAPLFSRRPINETRATSAIGKPDAVKVIEVGAVRAIADRIGRAIKLNIPIRVYANEAALFKAQPEIANQAEKDGAEGQINAVFYRNEVHIVASAYAKENDLEAAILESLAHEGQGHYGIRALYGNNSETGKALKELFSAIGGVTGVKRITAKNGIDMSLYLETAKGFSESHKAMYLADELLAHLQERNATASLTQRALNAIKAFYGAVREWLRSHGFENLATGTEADIALLLKRMRAASQNPPSKGNPAFIREASDTDNKAMLSRSNITKQAYEKRIDDLFDGDKANNEGVVVLDRSDVLEMLGFGDMPLRMNEKHAFEDGRFNHPLTKEQWKKIPEWIESPQAVFERGKDGNLTLIAPETFNGNPLIIAIKPDAEATGGRNQSKRHLMLTAYIKDKGNLPLQAMMNEGEARYIDIKNSRKFNAGSRVQFPSSGNELRGYGYKIHTGADLFKYRQSNNDENSGVMFSRSAFSGQATGQAVWETPSASTFDEFVYRIQDKQIDTKRVIEAIKKTGKAIADDLDVYLQETLFHGRAAKRTQDFVNNEVNPLVEYMRSTNMEMADLEEYLHARHAKEANAVIASRNLAMPDGGSGMTNAEADNYMASINPIRKRQFENAAKLVDEIIADTRKLIVDYGLEKQETVDGWTANFKHYVPLQREDKDGVMGIGQGFSVKGKEVKGRTGSTRKVVDILANVMMQRERIIVRGEKNRVAGALLGLAKENPMPNFWKVDRAPTHQIIDKNTGMVRSQVDPLYKMRPNVMVAKVNGVEHAIIFNESDPRAVRMAEALKNLDAAQLEGLMGATATATRYFAAINTQYNPIFGVTNMVRDIQEAMLNMTSTAIQGKQGEVFKNTFPSIFQIYKAERAARDGRSYNSETARLWQEFQEVGGQTGYRDQFRTSADRAKEIQKSLTPDAWAKTGLGKFFTADGRLTAPMELVRSKLSWLLDWLSDYNTAMENGVRLSAYKAGIESGMSKQQAAALAKSLTVNFNRKGQVTQQMGALYAFFNASVQGSARMAETLFEMGEAGNPKTIRLSKIGKRVLAGAATMGSMQTLMLAAAGFGDDEPPEFIRERNIVIPTGGKTYITIPLPLGFHTIYNLGRIPTEFALGGGQDKAKHFVSLLDVLADVYNPLGGAGLSLQTIAPTVLDPLVALGENKDFSGRNIAKESMNKQTPGHKLARDTASLPSTWLAEAINYLTGGSEFTRGVLSPTPDQIDYLFGQVTGGVGRELTKTMKSAQMAANGDEWLWHNVPLAGRFFGDADSSTGK